MAGRNGVYSESHYKSVARVRRDKERAKKRKRVRCLGPLHVWKYKEFSVPEGSYRRICSECQTHIDYARPLPSRAKL